VKKLNETVGVFYMGAVGLFAAVVAVGMIIEGTAKASTWAGGKIEDWKQKRAIRKAAAEEIATRR
jgi:heptaprenylglyceryl phosphate synthase